MVALQLIALAYFEVRMLIKTVVLFKKIKI